MKRFRDVLTPRRRQAIEALLRQIATIEAAVRAFPPTLCHGDCHIGNLLRDRDGHLVWADWQEVGIGRGPEDLSFLLQQAWFEGAAVSLDEVAEAYRERLERALGRNFSLSAIIAVMHAAELRTRLLEWPAYLKHAPEAALAQILDRIQYLAEGVGIRMD